MERFSRKREAILALLRSTDTHPSAQWIYERLKPEFPDLSLGTVYRNLAAFCASGEVCGVGEVDGEERFDGDTSEHIHFICDRCGGVFDLPGPVPAAPEAPPGYAIRRTELTFRGICPKCREK